MPFCTVMNLLIGFLYTTSSVFILANLFFPNILTHWPSSRGIIVDRVVQCTAAIWYAMHESTIQWRHKFSTTVNLPGTGDASSPHSCCARSPLVLGRRTAKLWCAGPPAGFQRTEYPSSSLKTFLTVYGNCIVNAFAKISHMFISSIFFEIVDEFLHQSCACAVHVITRKTVIRYVYSFQVLPPALHAGLRIVHERLVRHLPRPRISLHTRQLARSIQIISRCFY